MKKKVLKTILLALVLIVVVAGCSKKESVTEPAAVEVNKAPLKIGYSDWPGWVAWDIGVTKGWFAEEGVDVEFQWFEYVASMDAFAAGQVDAVAMTNGDALVTGSTGASNVMILLNDYSNGNDMVVALDGIDSVADLKGKKIGLEIGFVEHLLFLDALNKVGLSESDVTLVNVLTHQTAQTLASGEVDAIAAWQPNSGEALKAVAGSKAIYTSADAPGLIYDTLAVSPSSLSDRKADWQNVVKVWYRIVDYINDPANLDDVLEVMSARVGLEPMEYAEFMKGTRFLTLDEAKEIFAEGEGYSTLSGSSRIVDQFNLDNAVYDAPQDIDSYIDSSLTLSME